MARYFNKDLQQIVKTILETKTPALVLQLLVFPNEPCERPLKAKFPDLYCGMTYMKCYNLC